MFLKEIQLTNLLSSGQKKTLISAINESLAINDELVSVTESVYSKFKDEFKKSQFQYLNGEQNDIKFKTITVDTKFGKERIRIFFRCFNILNDKSSQHYEEKYSLGNAETIVELKEIYINAEFLSGTLKTNVKSLIQHELEHLFQVIRGKKLNSYGLGQKGVDAYNKAYRILKSNTQDLKLFHVSYVIYTLSESEVDAFVNQLYQELSSVGIRDAIQTLKNSNAYNYYLNSKKLLKIIKNNREAYEDVITSFGFEYEKFLKTFLKLNQRYITKIGKVLSRFNEENQPDEVLLNNLNEKLIKL
jgi:hypothetical protein